MTVYQFAGTIPGSKIFLRSYEVRSDMNLFQFQNFLVNDLGFAPGLLVMFRGYNGSGKLRGQWGFFDFGCGTMDAITIDTIVEKGITRLEFIYNLDKESKVVFAFDPEVKGTFSPKVSYPLLLEEKGRNPEQFADKYEDIGIYMPANPAEKHKKYADDEDLDDEDDLEDEDEDDETEELYESEPGTED